MSVLSAKMTLRLLFVCGASTGGAFRSTLELAEALRRRGHAVEVLVEASDGSRQARIAKRILDAEARLGDGRLAALLGAARRRLGARCRRVSRPSVHHSSPLPENAAPALAERLGAQAVIVSSIRRPAWRQILAAARAHHRAGILYMRGMSELEQLHHPDAIPDLLLSNTRSIADVARAAGHRVEYVPSFVDLEPALTDTTREVALLVGPTKLQGVDTALMLAEARPDVRFAFQQSWTLSGEEQQELSRRIERCPNVEIRPRVSHPAAVYRDARVLLAPHRVDNRPRVIIEAQANGIPVLASARPGLVDQMGRGGIAVPVDASDREWIDVFSRLWDDEITYLDLSEQSRSWARRREQDEEVIVSRLEKILEQAIASPRSDEPSPPGRST